MRIFKFRIWNNKTKSWVHGPNKIPTLDGINLLGETIIFGEILRGVSIDDLNGLVVLQYTGINDKNGKEIFEGDIIKYSFRLDEHGETETHFGEVYYDESVASFLFDKSFEWSLSDACIIKRSIEIVGNIYQDSYLIK